MESIANAVYDLANKHFGDYKNRNGQVIPKYCPICGGGENKDKETFSVGVYNGCWSCLRGSCPGIEGKREGNFKQLCDFYGEATFEFSSLPSIMKMAKKKYARPDESKLLPLTDKIINYFATRCISPDTLNDFKIASNADGNIVFPFYRNNELIYVKYRKPQKYDGNGFKEWQEANTEPILFGMDNVAFGKPLVICEGEIDAMALYEAGVHNVVSVPCGCNNLEWINLCWDWLEKFNQIILFGDSDEPGVKMISEIMSRLGEDRCMIPKEYPELIVNGKHCNKPCKDANEILACYGPEGLKALVDACEPAPIKGVIEVASIQRKQEHFVSMSKIPKLDEMLNGFVEGGVTILTGKRGSGKSTIGSTFILNAIQEGVPCCAYSGELSQAKFLDWILLPATETKYVTYYVSKTGKRIPTVSPEIEERIREWLKGKLYLFNDEETFEEDTQTAVLKTFEMCARRYGCKLFLVDNLLSLLPQADDEIKAQARLVKKIKQFARKYKAHVIVVAHPRKESANSTNTTLNNDSVSGASAITDLADNVLALTTPNINVLKNRSFGETGWVYCDYDPVNRRIFQMNIGDKTIYGWDHNGIQEPDPESKACLLPEYQPEEKEPF